MTSSADTVRTAEQAQPTVAAPREAPRQEERPRRRHDGYYWDCQEGAWRRCTG